VSILLPIVNYFRVLRPLHAVFWLACLCLGVYWNAVDHPFVHDDFLFIARNPFIGSFDPRTIWFRPVFSLPDGQMINPYYRPFLELVYRGQYALFGLEASAYHLVNIFVHLINGWLVYALLKMVFPEKRFLPFAVAVLFMAHPVQTEAVAAVAGISNTLVLLWSLAAFLFVVRFIHSRSVIRLGWLGMAGITFVLALLTKEQAVILPGLVAFRGWEAGARRDGPAGRDAGKAFFWLCGLVVMYFMFRSLIPGTAPVIDFNFDYETRRRLLAIPGILVMYLRVLIWPVNLYYYRSYDISRPWLPGLAALAGIVIITAVLFYRAPRDIRRQMALGFMWFMIPLLPVINIIPLVNEYSLVMTAEHFLYWPVIGAALVVLGLGQWVWRCALQPRWRPAAFGAGVAVVFICVNLSIRQNQIWAGEIPLFERLVENQPDFGRGRMALGESYYKAGQWAAGVEQYRRALEIMGRYIRLTEGSPSRKIYQDYAETISYSIIFGLENLERERELGPRGTE
jgi:hypothetical protein